MACRAAYFPSGAAAAKQSAIADLGCHPDPAARSGSHDKGASLGSVHWPHYCHLIGPRLGNPLFGSGGTDLPRGTDRNRLIPDLAVLAGSTRREIVAAGMTMVGRSAQGRKGHPPRRERVEGVSDRAVVVGTDASGRAGSSVDRRCWAGTAPEPRPKDQVDDWPDRVRRKRRIDLGVGCDLEVDAEDGVAVELAMSAERPR